MAIFAWIRASTCERGYHKRAPPDPMEKDRIRIYTDGACSPNPGVGGWAAVLIAHDGVGNSKGEREIKGAEPNSTNNRMELTAAIEGLRALKRPCAVRIFTDSKYLRNAFSKGWLDNWQRNGWRTASKKPVANEDLWRELIELDQIHDVEWSWVPGHSDDPYNERCDRLAVQAREDFNRGQPPI